MPRTFQSWVTESRSTCKPPLMGILENGQGCSSPRSVRGSTEWGVATSMESPTLRNTRAEIRSSLLGADKRWTRSVSGYGSRE